MRITYENPSGSSTRIGPGKWQLQDRELLVGVLSLWSYSFARRRKAADKFNESIPKTTSAQFNDITHGEIGRIIGTGSVRGSEDVHHPLSQWLGVRMRAISLPNGLNDTADPYEDFQTTTWWLGMFLSPMAQ
jgi:hypothetical protein